ncbi:MAG: M20/M25/M40 family metallo-hydrolase [Candidatus Margulisbacteria bacterium]|nr:M20/M25/M40 family metallo-hydrolase [Candidatus Margulisiibacteriota bacterium]
MINPKRLINTFKKLVRIDSLSLKEGKIIGFINKELKKMGLKPRITGRPNGGECGSLIVDLPGRGCKGPRILLNAHVDTVSPGNAVQLVDRKGFIRSNGKTILGADNKAGVAAILEILKVLKESKLSHPPLQIVFTVAEEIGLIGVKALDKKGLKADFAVVLDGGDIDKIIYKAPSQINISAKIIGRAAHAGIHPEDGIHAIKAASEAVAKMKLGRIDSETTTNIGIIQGGTATNIIPDEVELKGEARSHSKQKLHRQIRCMRRILEKTAAKRKAKAVIAAQEMYNAFEINRSNYILQVALRAVKQAGITPVIEQTGGGSDANIFNARGIPSIIMGVGADRVHTTNERIKKRDLIKGTEIILNLLKECRLLCAQSP